MTDGGPIKHDQDKPATHLLPPRALLETAKVMGHGAKKYSAWNYRKGGGMAHSRYYAAALRHLLAWNAGEDLDPDSGMPHLAHAACSVLILLDAQTEGYGEDDRWKKEVAGG